MSDFRIEIETVLKGNPTSELDALQVAIKDALGSYSQLEKQLAKTTKQLASTQDQIGNVREQLAEARDAGDAAGVASLEAKLAKLLKREEALAGKAQAATAALSAQEAEIRGMAGALEEMRAAEESSAQAADEAAEGQRDLKAGLKGLGGPLGETISLGEDLKDSWSGLVTQMGGAGPAAIGIAAASFAALGVAAAAAYVQLVKFGIGQANAARDTYLYVAALLESESAAEKLMSSFGKITSETGATSDRLVELTKDLKEAKIKASDMPDALRAIAIQEAAIGSDKTQELIDALKDGKKSASELAKEMDQKFGDIMRKRMLGLDQQLALVQEHIGALFEDIDIEAILTGFAKLVGLLDTTTASGRAIKAIVETMFSPLEDDMGTFVAIERFLIGFEIGAMKAAVAIKTVGKALGIDTTDLGKMVEMASAGEAAFFVLVAVLGAFGAVIGTVGTMIGAMVGGPIALLYGATQMLSGGFSSVSGFASSAASAIGSAFSSIGATIKAIDLTQIGSQMIDGLVNGVKSGADAVINALGGIVDSAVNAAKAKLGIASPSRVMAEIGGYTAEGFTVGVDDGAADAQGAMEALVAPPDPALATTQQGRGSGLNFTGATFVFNGVADAEQATMRFEEMLVGLLEGQLLQAGSAA